jgi:hypothetical protein
VDEDRIVVKNLSTGSRLFWAWVGGTALWGFVTLVDLVFHHSVM